MNYSLLQEYNIKLAGDSETDQVITLLKDVAQWLKNKQADQWQYLLAGGDNEEISEAISNKYTYIILADTELIGTFTLSPVQSDWDKHIFGVDDNHISLYLHRLAVLPKYIGKGIGKNILQWIQANNSSEKIYLKLDCVAHNARLNQFYKESGFEYIGEEDGHSKYQKKLK